MKCGDWVMWRTAEGVVIGLALVLDQSPTDAYYKQHAEWHPDAVSDAQWVPIVALALDGGGLYKVRWDPLTRVSALEELALEAP